MHIVYNLVTQLLRGSIDCLSAPGAGMEVQIQLPRRLDSSPPATRTSVARQ
jgi:signal transduction histidine kinase